MQPAQLSLMPQQAPAPPVAVIEQLPEPKAAALLLSRLIARMADPASADGEASVDE